MAKILWRRPDTAKPVTVLIFMTENQSESSGSLLTTCWCSHVSAMSSPVGNTELPCSPIQVEEVLEMLSNAVFTY